MIGYYVEGENVDGDYIAYEPEYIDLEDIKIECEKVLAYEGGGHFDIFNNDGNYIACVEV